VKNFIRNIILLLLYLLTFYTCKDTVNKKNQPIAEKGILDLRNWNFENDGIVSLDGEWEFFWEEFLEPSVFNIPVENQIIIRQPNRNKINILKSNLIKVPSAWNGYIINGKELSGDGYATYRLKLLVNGPVPLAMRIPTIASAYKVFINGLLIAEDGNIGKTKEEYYPYQNVRIIQITNPSTEYEIVFHISNFDHRLGGLWSKIELGESESIKDRREKYLFRDFILSGSFLIMGLYHFGLYSLRRKEKSVLSFGILSLAVSFYILFSGEFYAYNLFPNLNFKIGTKIEYITVYIGVSVAILFFDQIFSSEKIEKISIVIQRLPLFLTIPTFLFSIKIIDYGLILFQITTLVGLIYIIYLLSFAIYHKREGAKSYLMGFVIFGTCTVNDILVGQRIIQNDLYSPFGFFIFIFSQAFLLSTRFARAFSQVEDLSANLERKVIERTNQLNLALQKSDKLLLNILPEEVADELKEKGFVTPVLFESSSIMFTDFKGFTQIAEGLTPRELIKELDACFTQFDKVTERYNLEKLKTIGDSYMCAGGIPKVNTTHAIDSCLAALEIQSFMNRMKSLKQEINAPYWELRLGIHSGPVMAGVVGEKKFAYDIWGDTVNTASRMESSGTAGKINISYTTYELVKEIFDCDYRGEVEAKNKGKVKMYYLNRIKKEFSKDEQGLVPNGKFWNKFV